MTQPHAVHVLCARIILCGYTTNGPGFKPATQPQFVLGDVPWSCFFCVDSISWCFQQRNVATVGKVGDVIKILSLFYTNCFRDTSANSRRPTSNVVLFPSV